jgi:hypothetical protein
MPKIYGHLNCCGSERKEGAMGCTGDWDGEEKNEFVMLLGKPLGTWSVRVLMRIWGITLTFKSRASYIQDGRTATLQMLHFIYIFSTNISTEYFKHAAHSLFFSSKCRLFHKATFIGSCIHILHTGVCQNLNVKLRCQKVNMNLSCTSFLSFDVIQVYVVPTGKRLTFTKVFMWRNVTSVGISHELQK